MSAEDRRFAEKQKNNEVVGLKIRSLTEALTLPESPQAIKILRQEAVPIIIDYLQKFPTARRSRGAQDSEDDQSRAEVAAQIIAFPSNVNLSYALPLGDPFDQTPLSELRLPSKILLIKHALVDQKVLKIFHGSGDAAKGLEEMLYFLDSIDETSIGFISAVASILYNLVFDYRILDNLQAPKFDQKQNFLAIDPHNLNLLTATIAEWLFKPKTLDLFCEKSYYLFFHFRSPSAQDETMAERVYMRIVYLGFLYGKLDPSNPQFEEVKAVLTRYYPRGIPKEKYPAFFHDFLPLDEEVEDFESEHIEYEHPFSKGLSLLRSFWEDVFSQYWAFHCYQQGHESARPLTHSDFPRRRAPANPRHIYGSDLGGARAQMLNYGPAHEFAKDQTRSSTNPAAEALILSRYQGARKKLISKFMEIVQAYDPNNETSRERVLWACRLLKRKFEQIKSSIQLLTADDFSQKKYEEVVQDLVEIIGRSFLTSLFGQNFLKLDPVEQISLMTYALFIGNGNSFQGVEQTLFAFNKLVRPNLDKPIERDKDMEENFSPNSDWSVLIERAQSSLGEAKEKLQKLDPNATGVCSTEHYLFKQEFKKFVEKLLKVWGVTEFFKKETVEAMIADLSRFKIEKTEFMEEIFAKIPFMILVLHLFVSLSVFGVSQYDLEGEVTPYVHLLILLAVGSAMSTLAINRFYFSLQNKLLSAKSFKTRDQMLFSLLSNALEKAGRKYSQKSSSISKEKKGLPAMSLGVTAILTGIAALLIVKMDDYQSRLADWLAPDQQSWSLLSEVTNSSESPRLGKPTFEVWGPQEHLDEVVFWAGPTCVQVPEVGEAFCVDQSSIPASPLNIEPLTTRAQVEKEVSRLSELGYIVRTNLNRHNKDFEIPGGFKPEKVLVYVESNNDIAQIRADWHTVSYVRIHGDLPKHAVPFVVFAPIQDDDTDRDQPIANTLLPPEEKVEIGKTLLLSTNESIIPEEMWQTPELQHLQPIINKARQQVDLNLPPEFILQEIQKSLVDFGVTYGFQPFSSQPFENVAEILAEMAQLKDSGKESDPQFYYNQWVCDQFSFFIYVIAREAGLEVYYRQGFAHSSNSNLGGYGSQRHQLIMFRDQSGKLKIFEATLPAEGIDYPEVPASDTDYFDRWDRHERQQKIFMNIGLVTAGLILAGGVAGASKFVSKKRKEVQITRRGKLKESVGNFMDQAKPSTQLAVWHAFVGLVGLPDYAPNLLTHKQLGRVIGNSTWFRFGPNREVVEEMSVDEKEAYDAAYDMILIILGRHQQVATNLTAVRYKITYLADELYDGASGKKKGLKVLQQRTGDWIKPALETHESRNRVRRNLSLLLEQIPKAIGDIEQQREEKGSQGLSEEELQEINRSVEILRSIRDLV